MEIFKNHEILSDNYAPGKKRIVNVRMLQQLML